MSPDPKGIRFLTDRMLGTLCRYLRFMGYDTVSANSFNPGNNREDTELLSLGERERRILLTRDQELAARAGMAGVLIRSEDVVDQVHQLTDLGLVDPVIRMTRCSICNTLLRTASGDEIQAADYAPEEKNGLDFFYCPSCSRLYWNGSHRKNLKKRLSPRSDLPDKD